MPSLNKQNSAKSSQINAQQDLERRILHGMVCEWEAAWLSLDPDKQPQIRKPTFAIKNFKNQWGCWSPEKREISLSRQLVLNYPWDSIRDVLLHEMAHQIAHELLGASDQTPHGAAFNQACKLLHVDSAASANYVPLQDRLLQLTANAHDRHMLRVKKLLALAESKNRFEAEAAMAKAHELIARHNIELTQLDEKRRFLSVFLGSPALRHALEEYQLANLLQDYYFVSAIWVPAYVIQKGKMGRVLEISGTAHNLKIAAYVFDFIRTFIDAQWLNYNRNRDLNRYRKTDFAVGIIEGFSSKLASNMVKDEAPQELLALIQRGDPLLKKYFKFRYPHTASVQKSASQQNRSVLNDGKKLGQKLVIAKGICERKTGKRHLITHE